MVFARGDIDTSSNEMAIVKLSLEERSITAGPWRLARRRCL